MDAPAPGSPSHWEARLGDAVRAQRIHRGLSQVEVAQAANISRGALQHLEGGDGATISTFVKVLRALDATAWIDTLAPPPATFDPFDVLAEQTRRPSARQRVARRRVE